MGSIEVSLQFKNNLITIILLMLGLICTSAYTQNIELEEVIVVARRFDTSVASVNVPTEVINEYTIEAIQPIMIQDLLSRMNNIYFANSGPRGSETTMSLRGLYQRYLKVYLDDIDIADPSGAQLAPDLTNLLVNNIGKIELLRGSRGSLYGGDAISGVVNIISNTSHNQFSRVALLYGTYNTSQFSFSSSMPFENGGLTYSIQNYDSDGFSSLDERNGHSEADGHETTSMKIRFENFIGSINFRGSMQMNRSVTEFDDFNSDDTYGNYADKNQLYSQFSLAQQIRDGLDQKIIFNYTEFERNYHTEYFPASYEGKRNSIDYLINNNDQIYFGLNYENETTLTSDNLDRDSSLIGSFLNLNLMIGKLSLEPSLRIDHHSSFGSYPTFALSSSYILDDHWKLRISKSTGYRTPSNYELFAPNVGYGPIGNENLQPEESKSTEIGFNYSNNQIEFGLNLFKTEIDNLILWEYGLGNIQTEDRTTSQGIELNYSYAINQDESFYIKSGWTDARDITQDQLLRVPKTISRISYLNSNFFSMNLFIELARIGQSEDINYFNFPYEREELDSYLLLSSTITYPITESTQFYFKGDNLMDSQYQTIYGYGTPGRSIYIGYMSDL